MPNHSRGLTKDNVADFIQELDNNLGEQASSKALEHLWTAASQDLQGAADPFYLRFVADGVEKKQYFLRHT